jgi:hypothetical protein
MSDMLLWLSDAHGQYLPRDFANSFVNRAAHVAGVSDEEWSILEAGPDHEWYWEAWNDVCDNAVVIDGDTKYRVWQDGDCWLVPEGMVWDDCSETFVWPRDECGYIDEEDE